MIYLFLLKYIPRQVILTCDKQTKCIVGDYCSSHKLCYSCSYITENHCDSLTGCCSQEFLHQCPGSPYSCENTNGMYVNRPHGSDGGYNTNTSMSTLLVLEC